MPPAQSAAFSESSADTLVTRRVQKLHRACDKCYRLKERCTRRFITETCGRCDRLGLSCATIRPPRGAGRPVKEPRHVSARTDAGDSESEELKPGSSHSSAESMSSAPSIGKWINGLDDLSRDEKDELLFLLDQPENLNCYVVSPVFQNAKMRSLAAALPAALPVLKDAYLACAGALKSINSHHQENTKSVDGQVNLLRASAGMEKLRALPVATPEDAALCLTLGTSLTIYASSAVGYGAYEISQHCLSIVRPFVEAQMLDADAEPWLMFLALSEITDCLVHRRLPTIRTPWRQSLASRNDVVDGHLGLCATLLPYYHDLCVVSHSMANTTDASFMAMIERQLDQIQTEVEAWQPSPPGRFVEQFKSAEVVHLLAQAKLYRLAALLVSHRLRYTFGQQDSQASIWANEIMSELELARRVTKRSTHCVTLPFVVAALEMQNLAARRQALRNVDDYANQFTTIVRKTIKTFLTRVWWDRDHRTAASWFDSTIKPCVVLASFDTALFGI